MITARELAKHLAETAHIVFMEQGDNSLDGDITEEFSVMFREELDILNGNVRAVKCNNCEWRGIEELLNDELCPRCGVRSEGKIMDL